MGKSTLAEAIAERLREEAIANAVIDLDALSIVYPHPGPFVLAGEPSGGVAELRGGT